MYGNYFLNKLHHLYNAYSFYDFELDTPSVIPLRRNPIHLISHKWCIKGVSVLRCIIIYIKRIL